MSDKKIETIKLSEVDTNELLLHNGRLFFTIEDDVYCEDFVLNIILMFDDTTNEWIEVTDIDTSNANDYDFKEALNRFKEHLPWPYFDKVLDARKIVNEKVCEAERKLNHKKVIGWMRIDDVPGGYHQDDSDEAFIAVVEDIEKHGWACTGMEFSNRDLVAILNTHQYIGFSDRSWGRAMAAASGDYGQMDYAEYAFGFSDEVFDDDPIFPDEGLYEKDEIKESIFVSDSLLEELLYFYSNDASKMDEYKSVYTLVADPYEDHKFYEVFKRINLISPNFKQDYLPEDIFYFDDVTKFDDFYEELKENYSDKTLILCDVDLIHNMIENGPVYLLLLMVL